MDSMYIISRVTVKIRLLPGGIRHRHRFLGSHHISNPSNTSRRSFQVCISISVVLTLCIPIMPKRNNKNNRDRGRGSPNPRGNSQGRGRGRGRGRGGRGQSHNVNDSPSRLGGNYPHREIDYVVQVWQEPPSSCVAVF